MTVRLSILMILVLLGVRAPAAAQEVGNFQRFLGEIQLNTVFPGADNLGRLQDSPPVAPAIKDGKSLGYVFLNTDFVGATGYSGKPIHVVVGIDNNGVITGAQLVDHSEPIVLIGIPEDRINRVIDGYAGRDVAALSRGQSLQHDIDIVSGATVTVMVIDDSILRSAIKVARRYGLGGLAPEKQPRAGPAMEIDRENQSAEDWPTLARDGSVRSLKLSVGDINTAFESSNDPLAAEHPEPGNPNELFIELDTALVSVPTIGRSLLGENEYKNLETSLAPNQHAVLLMARGRYSFRGSSFVRGGIFDRFQLIQGDNSIRFRDKQYKRLRQVAAAGAPHFDEVALFVIPKSAAFEATEPWRIELLVGRATGARSKAFLTFDLSYSLPNRYLKTAPAIATLPSKQPVGAKPASVQLDQPLWQRLWRAKIVEVVILSVALGVLTLIFFFQDWLAQRPVLTDRVRLGFLVFTLFGLGFYANAQLSIVNVMTFFNALITDFRWEHFLMDPLVFMLWSAVAASLMFWGRGAFCGWLCPFGALQELLNRGAKALGVPQIELPWGLHERAWALKYMIFLVLFGASLHSLALAETLAEVEPFKTAIILKFMREWPFVLFAVSLLLAGLFIERFYCRYLCALGAALAVPGKLRLFEWLKRYKQCGSPCQRCYSECMVQAIHPEGRINPNECLYCLHCQTLYHDSERCPVVAQRELRHQHRILLPSTTDTSPPNHTDKRRDAVNVDEKPQTK